MIAASSADDITLVSKVPIHSPPPVSSLAMISNSKGSATLSRDELRSEAALVAVQNGHKSSTLPGDNRLEQIKRLQVRAISRSQEFDIVNTPINHKRNSLDIDAVDNGVHALRMKYEMPEVSPPPTVSPLVTDSKSRLRPTAKTGRCNSVGNSDSGRESMVLETDV